MGFLAYMVYVMKRIPYVITEHWSRYLPRVKGFNGRFRIAFTRLVVKNARAVMPVTLNLEAAMKSYALNNRNYKVVPNVVDELFFNARLNKKTSDIKRVIHVSTFEDKSKNISGILKGIKELAKNRQDFIMVLVGDGMDYKRMELLAKELQLNNQMIVFTGLLEKESLVNEFEQADYMLINSHYENMPVVINEAFACGLPVLSTQVGGISEHLNNERGRLMPAADPKAFVNHMNWMLDHCRSFDAQQIRAYAQQHFSYKEIGESLNQIYIQAIDQH